MIHRCLTLAIIFLAYFSLGHSQVTIGKIQKPLDGALLDLDNSTAATGTNSTKGMLLPRVELVDLNELFPMFDGTEADYATLKKSHTGLLVYQVDLCKFDGPGLYLWNGSNWNKLAENSTARVKSDRTAIELASGHDRRTLKTEDIYISWGGTTAPTWTRSTTGPSLSSPAAVSGTVGQAPYKMSITPKTLDVPLTSIEGEIVFKDQTCDKGLVDYKVKYEQTYYALKANGSLKDSHLAYKAAGTNSFDVQANVMWKAKVLSDPDGILSNVTPLTGGSTTKNNPPTTAIQYVGAADKKYSKASILYEDTSSPKLVNDVKVTIHSCDGTNPTIEEWAKRAGFDGTEIAAVKATKADSRITDNGIQMHLNQEGNIFLSSNFGSDPKGSDERWMLHNLNTKTYDSGQAYTGGTALNPGNVIYPYTIIRQQHPSATIEDLNGFAVNVPAWYLPDGKYINDDTSYNKDNRMGYLYTWDAAVAGKGGANGTAPFTEAGKKNQAQVQGLCPNGWHLPSDYEFSVLENAIISNANSFGDAVVGSIASIPNEYTNETDDYDTWRGTLHGKVMKDVCEVSEENTFIGTSNPINSPINNTDRPGFGAMLRGFGGDGTTGNYDENGYFWTSSGSDTKHASWSRAFSKEKNTVYRNAFHRGNLFSIRCKKN